MWPSQICSTRSFSEKNSCFWHLVGVNHYISIFTPYDELFSIFYPEFEHSPKRFHCVIYTSWQWGGEDISQIWNRTSTATSRTSAPFTFGLLSQERKGEPQKHRVASFHRTILVAAPRRPFSFLRSIESGLRRGMI